MILDTQLLIGLSNNDPDAVQKANELESLPTRIPTVVVFELLYVVRTGLFITEQKVANDVKAHFV
jgi:predicted nucleic acid-binding protein